MVWTWAGPGNRKSPVMTTVLALRQISEARLRRGSHPLLSPAAAIGAAAARTGAGG